MGAGLFYYDLKTGQSVYDPKFNAATKKYKWISCLLYAGDNHLYVNPEKRNVPLYKNDAFQKVQKRRVQKSGEPGPSLHDQSPPLFSHLNTI
jgi:hypothetical protein